MIEQPDDSSSLSFGFRSLDPPASSCLGRIIRSDDHGKQQPRSAVAQQWFESPASLYRCNLSGKCFGNAPHQRVTQKKPPQSSCRLSKPLGCVISEPLIRPQQSTKAPMISRCSRAEPRFVDDPTSEPAVPLECQPQLVKQLFVRQSDCKVGKNLLGTKVKLFGDNRLKRLCANCPP